MSEATIVIDEAEVGKRFRDAANDTVHSHDSYLKWLSEGVSVLDKNLDTKMDIAKEKATVRIQMPENWIIHSAPGMKYAMCDLIHNGMMSDWYDGKDADKAKRFRQAAELNKAQLQSIINSLDM